MRPIDADTAEKKLAELVELYEKRMPDWSPNDMLTSGRDAAFKWGFKADGVEKALEIIKDMPTVDAEPVKHGHWIKTPSPYHVKCSSCKTMICIKFYGVKVEKFCRNCGAKMDGESE